MRHGGPALTATGVKPGERLGIPLSRRVAALVRGHEAPAALLLYLVVALLVERHVVTHLNSSCACNGGTATPSVFSTPTAFMWALVWWPHAILHLQNPLTSHAIWTPDGLDLARATSVPLAALIASPLTLLSSPLVSYNLLSIIAPALGAFAAYRLCLYLTRAQPASVLGGYLYGFSSFELAHLLGLLHMLFIFVAPAVTLLTLKRLDDVVSTRRYVVQVSLLLIAQMLLSTEMFATLACMGAVALFAGWLFSPPDARSRIVQLLLPLAAAYAVTLIVCSPYLYYAFGTGAPYAQGGNYDTALLSFVVPSPITWLGGHELTSISTKFPTNFAEDGSYLGLPLIAIFVLFAVRRWRTVAGRVLLSVAGVATLWSLGRRLAISGPTGVKLPAAVFDHIPVLEQVLPVRIVMYLALTASAAAAMWLADHGGHAAYRWGLATLAVLFLVPDAGAVYPKSTVPMLHSRVVQPRLFATNLYRRYLRRDEIVLPLPFASAGPSMLWQADTHMYFRMASGHFGVPPGDYSGQPIVAQLLNNAPGPRAPAELRSFILAHHVSAIVADGSSAQPWLTVLAGLGLEPAHAGGLLVYDVPAAWNHT